MRYARLLHGLGLRAGLTVRAPVIHAHGWSRLICELPVGGAPHARFGTAGARHPGILPPSVVGLGTASPISPLARGELVHAGPHQLRRDLEDLGGVGQQVRLRQVTVAVVGRLRQRVPDTARTRCGLSCGIPTSRAWTSCDAGWRRDAGDVSAGWELAWLLREQGKRDEVIPVLRRMEATRNRRGDSVRWLFVRFAPVEGGPRFPSRRSPILVFSYPVSAAPTLSADSGADWPAAAE